MRAILSTLSLLFCLNVYAIEVLEFDNEAQREAYSELTAELRCLVCQNQNLADSDAPLAVDLKHEIRDMLLAGQNQQEITEFMVQRYGDFVLYRPPVQTNTYLLWGLPVLLVLIALIFMVIFSRRHTQEAAAPASHTTEETLSILEEEEP